MFPRNVVHYLPVHKMSLDDLLIAPPRTYGISDSEKTSSNCVLCNFTHVIDRNFYLMQMLHFMLKRKYNVDIIFGSRMLYLLILRFVLKISSVINQVKFLCVCHN
jgi:hypothetical protein